MISTDVMTENLDIINAAVTLIIKAAILASSFSGRVRKRSLKSLSKMDANDKDKEIIFLRDKVYQQQIQITIFQKGLQKKQTNKRYTLREKFFILCYMETFQVPDAESKRNWALQNQLFTDGCIRSPDSDEPHRPTLSR